MGIFMGAFTVLIIIFGLISSIGGFVFGIWLLVVGEWEVLLTGFAMSLVMPWAYFIVTLPALGLMFFLKIAEKSLVASAILGFLGALINDMALVVWTGIVFLLIQVPGHEVVSALFGFSVALAPVVYMARHEPPDDIGANLGLILTLFSYASIVIVWFWTGLFDMSISILLGILTAAFATYTAVVETKASGGF